MKSFQIIILVCCFLFASETFGQNSFQKDSLQIKVYTEIEYEHSLVKAITVKKVFCDYCSKNQIKYLSEKAEEIAYYDRFNPNERMVNGIRKFAIIIRVSKEDLLGMKYDEDKE